MALFCKLLGSLEGRFSFFFLVCAAKAFAEPQISLGIGCIEQDELQEELRCFWQISTGLLDSAQPVLRTFFQRVEEGEGQEDIAGLLQIVAKHEAAAELEQGFLVSFA